MPRLDRCWLWYLCCVFAVMPIVGRAEEEPLTADPPAAMPDWSHLSVTSTPFMRLFGKQEAGALRPATGAPYLLTGHLSGSTTREVWNLTNGKRAGSLTGRFDVNVGNLALSPDGQRVAVIRKKSFTSIGAEFWSVTSGKKEASVELGTGGEPVVWAGFADPETLLTVHQVSEVVHCLRIVTSTAEGAPRELPLPENLDPRVIALSPGGHLLAVVTTSGTLSLIDVRPNAKSVPRSLSTDENLKCAALKFAPEGQELAGVFTSGLIRAGQVWHDIAVWNLADGQLATHVQDVPLAPRALPLIAGADGQVPSVVPFEWLEDGSAFLLGDHSLVDRETGRVVWQLRQPFEGQATIPVQILGTDYLLLSRRRGNVDQLAIIKLPWQEIDLGLKGLKEQSPAWLKPGDKLSLNFEFGGLRFRTPKQVESSLALALQEQLKLSGFEVAAGQPVTLHVAYAETVSGFMQKQEGVFPFGGPPLPPPPVFGPGFPRRRRMADPGPVGTGTAFVVHADGYLLTCAHVIGTAASVDVKLGEKTYHGRVLAKNVGHDFALLKVEVSGLPTVPLADSDKIELGEEVRAIGYPISTVLGDSIKVTRGTIAGQVQRNGQTMFQVDASINPGNSGGPLINDQGAVVGINSAKLVGEDVDNVGFSIPINDVKALLKEHKVTFREPGVAKPLTGPELVKLVTPAVALVTSRGGTEVDPLQMGQVPATRIACVLSLRVDGQAAPVWSEEIVVDPQRLQVAGALHEEAVRDLTFEQFAQRLRGVQFPYYISRTVPPITLPLITDLARQEAATQPTVAPRKTRRGFGSGFNAPDPN